MELNSDVGCFSANFARVTQAQYPTKNIVIQPTTVQPTSTMPPKVHLIRHAQGEHNVTVRKTIPEARTWIDSSTARLHNPRCSVDPERQRAVSRPQCSVSKSRGRGHCVRIPTSAHHPDGSPEPRTSSIAARCAVYPSPGAAGSGRHCERHGHCGHSRRPGATTAGLVLSGRAGL
jgi:hypothetical protein